MSDNALDLADTLDRKAGQLEALLLVASSEAFDNFTKPVKDNYLWVCSDLATQLRDGLDNYRKALKESAQAQGGES